MFAARLLRRSLFLYELSVSEGDKKTYRSIRTAIILLEWQSLTVQDDVLELRCIPVRTRRFGRILVRVAFIQPLGAHLQDVPRPQGDMEAATAVRSPRTANKFMLFTYSVLHLLVLNLLTPNVNYSGRTAPLTSKVAFYIFMQQI